MAHTTQPKATAGRPAEAQRLPLDIFWRWLPLICWMGLIYYLSNQPKLPHPARKLGITDYVFDYGAHAFFFGTLTILAWRVLRIPRRSWPEWLSNQAIRWAALGAMLYAASDELHQIFVPGRWAKLTDFLADCVGIAAAMGCLALWRRLADKLASEARMGRGV